MPSDSVLFCVYCSVSKVFSLQNSELDSAVFIARFGYYDLGPYSMLYGLCFIFLVFFHDLHSAYGFNSFP